MQKMAPKIATGLGLTEMAGFCTYTPLMWSVEQISNSIGFAYPISPISIRSPMKENRMAGDMKPDKEIGEICFSGP